MRRSLFLCFLFFTALGASQAQILTVRDATTKLPVELVSVYSRDARLQAFTNVRGQLSLSDFGSAQQFDIARVGYVNRKISRSELDAAGFEVELFPTQLTLDQVVISASRWMQERTDVSNRVVTVTPAQVQLQQPQTAADLLALSGQLFVQKSQQAGGSPMIRGFSTNRLLYAVDGVRMNTAIFRSGNLHNVISLDAFMMEQTEILFGPGSTLYGSDAIGGVMSFQTLTPRFSVGKRLETSGNSTIRTSSANNERTIHAHVSSGGKRWASVSGVTFSTFGDLKTGSHGPDEYLRPTYVVRDGYRDSVVINPDPERQVWSGYSQWNLMQKLRYKASANLDFQYGFHHSETSNYGRFDRLTRPRRTSLRSAEFGYGPQRWTMNLLTVSHTAATGFYDDLALRFSNQLFEESRFDRDMNDEILRTRAEKVSAYGLNADFRKHLDSVQTLFYGLEGVLNNVHSAGLDVNIISNENSAAPSRYPESRWTSMAFYVQYQHRISKKRTFSSGIRVNRFHLESDFTGNAVFYPLSFENAALTKTGITGSIGAVWHPEEKVSLSATLSTGFRSPNVDDMGKIFDSTPGSVVVPNPDLGAEYAWNGELSAARQFGNAIKIDVTAFYTRLNNALVRRPFMLAGADSVRYNGTLSAVEAVQNAAFATVFGFQGGLEWQVNSSISGSSVFAWQDGTEELENGSRDRLRHAAPGALTNRLNIKSGRFTFQIRGTHTAAVAFADLPQEERAKDWLYAKDANGNPYAPAWSVYDVHMLVKMNRNWSVTTAVENVLNTRYRPYSAGISAPGRNLVVAVRGGF